MYVKFDISNTYISGVTNINMEKKDKYGCHTKNNWKIIPIICADMQSTQMHVCKM